MGNISTWSTTAASNNANPPDGAPEGMAPSAVNNTIRANMAGVRTWYEDAEWTDLGYTHVFVASTQFKIAGTDYTAEYHVGRRVRVVAATPGTIYGTITASAFSTDTTVTVAFDSGSLSNETLTVSLGALSGDNSSMPGVEVSEDDWTFQGNVTVEGTTTMTGNATASGDLTVNGTLAADKGVLPRSWLAGFTLSNDTDTAHDIAIAAGAARDSTDAADMRLSATLTKQIDANWAEGDDAGGFPSGLTLSADTWYRVFVISKTDGTVDGGFDTSATATNLLTDASAYTYYRRIGWVLTDASSNIQQFIQTGDEFRWTDRSAIDVDSFGSVGTTAATAAISAPPLTLARITLRVQRDGTGVADVYMTETDVDDEAPSTAFTAPMSSATLIASGSGERVLSGQMDLRTNASSQLRARASAAATAVRVQVLGWIDRRGRDD